ncbi:hypothetical protein TUM18999_34780 [Pseudomonas tohonis]|uniref:Uncharacterized protein n=1 Tax=Pseudomonas tohonis TaxID=2725477 RepID=A0A6J4E636_9PSED|nr:hypothetical protein TUM18999_34780 [Pseudomonas tohonis]GJN56380.1 hypothetical protein TUM20286_61320 [Pseudomonas tohonis]
MEEGTVLVGHMVADDFLPVGFHPLGHADRFLQLPFTGMPGRGALAGSLFHGLPSGKGLPGLGSPGWLRRR